MIRRHGPADEGRCEVIEYFDDLTWLGHFPILGI
jgi:hypothetical protein